MYVIYVDLKDEVKIIGKNYSFLDPATLIAEKKYADKVLFFYSFLEAKKAIEDMSYKFNIFLSDFEIHEVQTRIVY